MDLPDSIIYSSLNIKAPRYVKKSVNVRQSLMRLISENLNFVKKFLYYRHIIIICQKVEVKQIITEKLLDMN
jgi:hypothetical protein